MLVFAVLLVLPFAPEADAANQTVFPLPNPESSPWDIVAGPDRALWFTEFDGNRIGRISLFGQIAEFAIPTASSQPVGIALGPDGNLWFTENYRDKIGRITPTGVFTEFDVPTPYAGPIAIIAGPGGNLWFSELAGEKLGRITPDGSSRSSIRGRKPAPPAWRRGRGTIPCGTRSTRGTASSASPRTDADFGGPRGLVPRST